MVSTCYSPPVASPPRNSRAFCIFWYESILLKLYVESSVFVYRCCTTWSEIHNKVLLRNCVRNPSRLRCGPKQQDVGSDRFDVVLAVDITIIVIFISTIYYPEDGGSTFLRRISKCLPKCMTSHSRMATLWMHRDTRTFAFWEPFERWTVRAKTRFCNVS